MPLRLGPNGGVAKPSSSTKGQRSARPPASKVIIIDLTRESTNETKLEGSREGSAQEKRSEDASELYDEGDDDEDEDEDEVEDEVEDEDEDEDKDEDEGDEDERGGHRSSGAGTQERTTGARQAAVGRPQAENNHKVARPAQDAILEDSYIVTSLYHSPRGMRDDHTIIGLFSTEREAADASLEDFHQRCNNQADGWEWGHRRGDGMLQLHGHCEDGEDDHYRYTTSIKRVQQKRAAAVQPNPRPVQPSYVYVVKEEQRENVGADDPQGFYNEEGDLKAVHIHGIYANLDAANDDAREIYENIVEDFLDDAETISDDFRDGMAAIVVANPQEEMTYSISVARRSLR